MKRAVLFLLTPLLFLLAACGGGSSYNPGAPNGWEADGTKWWIEGVDTSVAFRDLTSLQTMDVGASYAPFGAGQVLSSIRQSLIRAYRNHPEVVDSLFTLRVAPQIEDNFEGRDQEELKREAYQTLTKYFQERAVLIFGEAYGRKATALRLFRERGYEATTMRAIAKEAGVSVGNAYYYFGSKRDLYLAVVKDGDPGQRVAGVVVLDHEAPEAYGTVPWAIETSPEEVLVVHVLGVAPEFLRQGVARFLVDAALDVARQKGCRTVRLDAYVENTPARELYASHGFTDLGVHTVRYEGTDLNRFHLFERVL